MTHSKAKEVHLKVFQYMQEHPELTLMQLSELTGYGKSMLSKIAIKYGGVGERNVVRKEKLGRLFDVKS